MRPGGAAAQRKRWAECGRRVNFSSPLTTGLIACVLHDRELVYQGVPSGTAVTPGMYGRGMTVSSTTPSAWPRVPKTAAPPFTGFVLSANATAAMLAMASGGWRFGRAGSNVQLTFLNINDYFVSGSPDTNDVALCVTVDANGGTGTAYVKNRTGTISIATTAVGTMQAAGDSLTVGMNNSTSATSGTSMVFAAVWNRVLSGAEIRALFANPFQFLTV